jgi:hypothetical protein
VRRAIDEVSGQSWSEKFGPLWDKWDRPVHQGANAPGHEIIVPGATTMAMWREGLRPVTERYLADLAAHSFPNARATYDKLVGALQQ